VVNQTTKYNAAYVLPNTLKFALLPWLAGIPLRMGIKEKVGTD
jgi:ADP-heptose:LPS heptosyltransferase